MGRITHFSVALDLRQVVYYPGQVLSGNVTLTLNEPMKMRSIKLKFKGESYCHWRKGKKRRYTGKEHIMKEIKVLFGGHSESELHLAGTFTYPFSYVLRDGIPSSFEGKFGHIRYVLKCTIDKPWKFDHKVKRPIVVNDIIDTNKTIYANPVTGNKHKEVGCCCCKAGILEFSSSIDRSCYCPGEAILVNANVDNKTTRNMSAMHVKLIQTITYNGIHGRNSRDSKVTSKVVAKLSGPKIPKGEDAAWQNQLFGIPALPPSITNSAIIKVQYMVKVFVGVPCGINPFIEFNITMGTVPFLGTYGQSVDYGTKKGTPKGCLDDFTALPPPPPKVLGYPEMAPPSYSSVVGKKEVNIRKDKDTHTKGHLMYQPVYTFAQRYQGSLAPVDAVPAKR